ncbi:alcohol dehydrogenase [Mycena galopus ATCC 62051]|nr:alcohol dehydrogenase [Mycena galopus ATCC 62051]
MWDKSGGRNTVYVLPCRHLRGPRKVGRSPSGKNSRFLLIRSHPLRNIPRTDLEMAPIPNARVLFNSILKATGYPVPGETTIYDKTQEIDLETVPLNGGFLIKTLVLSVDPYFRRRMRAGIDGYLSITGAFKIGQPLDGFGVAVVLRSENPEVAVGKHIYGPSILHQEYAVLSELGHAEIIEKHPDLPWSVYVGALGMPGQTAFVGWKEYSEAKPGEVAFVTTGAGGVGAMAVQLAKEAGLKVISSAGSEEKVKFMESIGADVAFNYKTTDTREVLEKEGPINIFWDNVGGEVLDAAIEFAAQNGRFIECGAISGYNTGQTPIKNFSMMVGKCLHFHGFLVWPLLPKYSEEFYATMPEKLASGKFKYSEEITKGLDKVGEVILAVQMGTSKGKSVVVVAEE